VNDLTQLSKTLKYSRNSQKQKLMEGRRIFTRPFRHLIRRFGFDIVFAPQYGFPPDVAKEDIALVREVQPYTMTSPEKIFALMDAIRYISRDRIEGDVVECGVWRGGSMMVAARTLLQLGDTRRTLHLYDTFGGMPEPSEKDFDYNKTPAGAFLETDAGVQAYAPLDQVKKMMRSTGYPSHKICYVVGKVEDTLPAKAPDRIALLRLDTDWYESTRHELIHLFPRLSIGGVLIIDDYGSWEGCRLATDEYFAQANIKILLIRTDRGRIAVKQ